MYCAAHFRIGPEIIPTNRAKSLLLKNDSDMELVTVLRSNLYESITPSLILELNALKDHLQTQSLIHL